MKLKKRAGVTGKVIGLCHSQRSTERLQKLGFCDYVFSADATQPVPVMEKIAELTNGEMCDITINNVNITDTEMTSILCTKNDRFGLFLLYGDQFYEGCFGGGRCRQRCDDDRLETGTPKDMLRLHCRNFVKARHYGRYLQSCMPKEWKSLKG